jgi:peptidoglycan/LPS O-acetylase OafA/YrhL
MAQSQGRHLSLSAGAQVFRLDINALRALSVLAVLGYHFEMPGFAGGFVGVDLFLVITGYLMTAKVMNDLMQDRFSFLDFSLMRLRRIFPALAVVIVASAVLGWFVTLPGEYQKHLRQACYALVFLSNFAFDNDNGYFAMAAQTKPLLHTWSLAVEWQFYIWMPLVVSRVWRWASALKSKVAATMLALQVIAALSLIWCLWQSHDDAMASAFFSLRARAWEPLAGGLIAVAEVRCRMSGVARPSWMSTPFVAVFGWVLVLGCIAYPFPTSDWPGILTTIPVLGASLIVGARQGAGAAGVLDISPIQRIGDWSYSIYLWHWPLWVFALSWLSLRGHAVDVVEKALLLVVSLAIGAMSYRYIEQPFRLRRDIWTPRRLTMTAGAVLSVFLVFTAAAFLDQGFPARLPDYLLPAEMARATDTPRDECFRNSNSVNRATETYCGFGSAAAAAEPSAILWGDSFANQYLDPISSAAVENGVYGLIATQSACRPFLDDPARNSADRQACRNFNRSTLDFVLNHAEPSVVILGGNWGSAIEVTALVDQLLASGKAVVLIMPLLNIGFDVPQRWIENQVRAGGAISEWKVEADPSLTMSGLRAEVAQNLDKYRDDPRLVTLDPQTAVCEQGFCYLVRNGQANFRDTAHISNVNAIQYKGLFDNAFKSALRARTEAGTKLGWASSPSAR